MMLTYVSELSDVDVLISKHELKQFLHELELRSIPYVVINEGYQIRISIHHPEQELDVLFKQIGEGYKLRFKQIQFSNSLFTELFQNLLMKLKGHGIVKMFGPESIVIHHIQFGEPIRITEVVGKQKKVLLDREHSVTIEQVIEALKLQVVEERIPKLRQEIDQELAQLSIMLSLNNTRGIEQSKQRLKELSLEMIMLEM